jgi:hypothetical protein
LTHISYKILRASACHLLLITRTEYITEDLPFCLAHAISGSYQN